MTAQSAHRARGSTPSRATFWPSRLRTARSVTVCFAICVFVAACHDDEHATLSPTAEGSHASSAAPLAQGVTAADTAPTGSIAILASPAQPLTKQADVADSPTAAPLVPPVIHTVD
ncbi:MAG TPA: hypothetical protein VGG24_20890 [Paraburkholderia sp.]|jgi:hypothetical protein